MESAAAMKAYEGVLPPASNGGRDAYLTTDPDHGAGPGNCSGEAPPQGPCWENPVEKYAYFALDMPISLLGVVTNVLNLAVFSSKPFRRKLPAYQLLVSLAVADLLTCAFVFPIGLCRCVEAAGEAGARAQQVYDVYIYLPLANTCATASIWLLTVVAFERYVSVAHPLAARRLWSPRATAVTVVAAYVAALALNTPYFFLRVPGTEGPPPVYTAWGRSPGAAAFGWVRLVVVKLVPITLMAVLNWLLISALWRFNSRQRRRQQRSGRGVHKVAPAPEGEAEGGVKRPQPTLVNPRQSMQMRVTAMVVSISVVTLLCHALEPFAHAPLFAAIFGICKVYGPGHTALIVTSNVLETFSVASNFFFYCVFNQQFWQILSAIMCSCTRSKRRHNQTVYSVDDTRGGGSVEGLSTIHIS